MDVTTDRSPFPGLRPFTRDEADLFFGRDAQSDELVRRLASRRFLAVVGTSGSGKSSLVRAGLLPALDSGFMAAAGSHWRVAIMRPQDDPIGYLARAIIGTGVLARLSLSAPSAEGVVETTLRRSGLGLVETAHLARLQPQENLLVLVDQFEELFRFAALVKSQHAADDAPAFVKLLLEAVRQQDVPVYVVITMRSDFLGDCARFHDLPEAISDSQYLVPRLTRDELRAVITGPVGVCGGRIAPSLLQRLLNEVGDDPDQLPVLQHALMRTWDHWGRRTPEMSQEDLDVVGGLERALSRHADEAYLALASDADRAIAARLFKCLSEREPSNREVRRPTRLSVIAEVAGVDPRDVTRVVDVFRSPDRAFLVPLHTVALSADDPIDIAHESLIRQWHRLHAWVEEEADSAAVYRDLVYAARRHRLHQGGLWAEPDLSRGRQWQEREQPSRAWAERYGAGLEDAIEFLSESAAAQEALARAEQQRLEAERAARDRELQQARALAEIQKQRADAQTRANAAQRRFNAALAGLLVFTVVAGVFGWWQNSRLTDERDRARRNESAAVMAGVLANSVAALNTDPELGMLIALKALDDPDGKLPANAAGLADALSRAMSVSRLRKRFAVGDATKRLRLVAYSADGSMLATEGEGNTVVVRDPESGEPKFSPIEYEGEVQSFAFSPSKMAFGDSVLPQDLLAAASGKNVKIRSLGEKAVEKVLPHQDTVIDLKFGFGGQLLATAQVDGLIRIWDVRSGTELKIPSEMRQESVVGLSFCAEGKYLATVNSDHWVEVWDAQTGRRRFERFVASRRDLNFVRFSPDCSYLATGAEDWVVNIWNASNGVKVSTLFGHTNTVFDAAFSPDHRTIITASADTTLRLYDTESGRQLYVLRGSGKPVEGVAFCPDQDHVASVAWDGSLRIWSVRGLLDKVSMTAFSDNGERLLTANPDGTVPFWDASTGDASAYGIVDQVSSVAINADSTYLATGKVTGEIQLWQGTKLPKLHRTFSRHRDAITNLGFSLNGKRLASVSNNDAYVWSVDADKPIFRMESGKYFFDTSIALNADGSYAVTADRTGELNLWRVGGGSTPLTLSKAAKGRVVMAIFSQDGRWLACALEYGTVLLWNMANPQAKPRALEQGGYIMSIAFSPQSTRLVSAGMNETAKVWDVLSPDKDKAPVLLIGHSGVIESAAFSSNGEQVVTASWDRTARTWDATSGAQLTLLRHEREVKDALFSHDGERLTTVTADGIVRAHPFDLEKLKAMARERITRKLTPDECNAYLRGLLCR